LEEWGEQSDAVWLAMSSSSLAGGRWGGPVIFQSIDYLWSLFVWQSCNDMIRGNQNPEEKEKEKKRRRYESLQKKKKMIQNDGGYGWVLVGSQLRWKSISQFQQFSWNCYFVG